MWRDPRQSKTDPKARQTEKPKRFKLVKLEERIAPSAPKNHGGGNFFDRFLKGKIERGSWFKHVHEWWRRRDDPQVLFLRYEELKRDLERTIRRIAAFCGVNLSAERLSVIVDRCSFRFMKRHEDKFDPAMEYLWEQGVRLNCFIRNGRIGDGANELTGEQRARFDALYRQLWPANESGLS